MQQGQVFQLKRKGRDGESQWAYRYRAGGRNSQRVQRGGFASKHAATDALERSLDRVRREQRIPRSLTFVEPATDASTRSDSSTRSTRWRSSRRRRPTARGR
jgi:hypothetical protein